MKINLGTLLNDRSGKGVAVFFIRSLIALLVGGACWFAGNEVLFGEVGIQKTVENVSNASQKFADIPGTFHWFYSIFPLLMLVGAFIYVIYGALKQEPGGVNYE